MKTTQRTTYYQDQMNKIVINGQFEPTFQFSDEHTKTNRMNLNEESAKVLIKWLQGYLNYKAN